MDCRCPLKLSDKPESWCHMAVLRLKALRNAGRELTEQEEALLPGCPWAVNHQLANYCFFKMAEDFIEEQQFSEVEVAHFLNVSIDTVKKIEKTALNKLKEVSSFQEIRDVHGSDKIVSDGPDESESNLIN